MTHPTDFESFWRGTIQALDATDPELAVKVLDEPTNPDLRLMELALTSFGNVRIQGYALDWRDRKPRPLVIHAHGYGSVCEHRWSWAAVGLNVVGVDVRGYGRSRDALPVRSPHGWVPTGCEAAETIALRGAVCDYVQAVRRAARFTSPS